MIVTRWIKMPILQDFNWRTVNSVGKMNSWNCSSGATRLLERSTVSLPSFATQVISSTPISDASADELAESL